MRLKIDVESIVCQATTLEVSPDEFYYAIFVTQNSSDAEREEAKSSLLGKYVSPIRRNVRRDDWWKPDVHLDFPIDARTQNVSIVLAGYEKDNGEIYERLKEEADSAIVPSSPEWSEVELPAGPSEWRKPTVWLKAAISLVRLLFKWSRNDDLIEIEGRGFEVPTKPTTYQRAITLVGRSNRGSFPAGGRYTVQLQIRFVEEA